MNPPIQLLSSIVFTNMILSTKLYFTTSIRFDTARQTLKSLRIMTKKISTDPCKIALTLDIIGGKWKGPIIWWIKDEPKRFNELRRLLDGITQRTLTKQLRELTRDGLVERNQFEEIPPRVEYSLTPLCKSLIPILDELSNWGKENTKAIEKSRNSYKGPV